VKGLVGAFTNPVDAAVGAGEPQGKAKTCQAEATVVLGFAGCVQLKMAEVERTAEFVKVTGLLHVGAGAHVTLLIHPAAVVEPFEVNTNVKHPETDEDVMTGGKVVPDKVANKGALALLPSYTLKRSTPFSVLNEVKVTVTKSPGFVGQIVVVTLALLL